MNYLFSLPDEIIEDILYHLDDIIPICLTDDRIITLNNNRWWINKFKIDHVTLPLILPNTLNEWMISYKVEKVIDYIKNRNPLRNASIELNANHFIYYFFKLAGYQKFQYKRTKINTPKLVNKIVINQYIHLYWGKNDNENIDLYELKNGESRYGYTDAHIIKIRPFLYKCFKLNVINFTINSFDNSSKY